MKLLKGLSMFIIGFHLISCSSSLTRKDYVDYLQDEANGLMHVFEYNNVKWEWAYKPTALVFYNHLERLKNQHERDSMLSNYADYAYFNLDLSYNGQEYLSYAPQSRANFGKTVEDLSFNVRDWLFLVNEQKDTIPLMDFNHARHYGMGKSNTILCTYSKEDIDNSKQLRLIIKDFGTGIGEISFKQDIDKLKDLPKLKLD